MAAAPADRDGIPGADRHLVASSAGRHVAGVVCGLAAGAGFAGFLIGLNRAGSGTDLWPVGAADLAAVAAAVCIGAPTGQLGLPPPRTRLLCLLTGAIAAAGTMSYFPATRTRCYGRALPNPLDAWNHGRVEVVGWGRQL